MKILVADYIYTPEGFIHNKAIAFTETIQDIDRAEILQKKYPDAQIIETEVNSVIYPGFINTHVHLEFSANKTSLLYGSFMPWLHSVIEHRDDLMGACDNTVMQRECEVMMRSGIPTV